MWLHSSPAIWAVLHFSEKAFSEAESFWAHVCGTWAGGRALETSRLPLQMWLPAPPVAPASPSLRQRTAPAHLQNAART